jgi:branched-subunit amino acid transport protein
VSLEALVAILGMAAITFAVRAAGLMLADRLPTEGFVAAWMRHIPGAVLAALVAPAIVTGGLAESIGAAVVALAFLLTRNLFVAMVGGVLVVYLSRTFLGL